MKPLGDRPSLPIRRRLGAAFGAAALVLLVGIVTTVSARKMLHAYSDVDAATHTIAELREISTSLLDAESSVRGYMLTNDHRFLATYSDAVRDTHQELEHVKQDLRDNTATRGDLRRLETAAQATLSTTSEILSLARADRLGAGRRILESESRAEMDSVRAVVGRLVHTESARLADRTRDRERNTRATLALIVGGAAVAFMLLAAVLSGLRREVIHETQLHQRLVSQKRQLDLQTRELQEQHTTLEETNQSLVSASAAALAARERLRLILESAESGIYGLDHEMRCTFMNPAGARMLGYETYELVGTVIHNVIHHSRPDGTPYPASECPIAEAARGGSGKRNDEEVYWRKDGSPLHVDYTAAPMSGPDDSGGAVVTFLDITQRKHQAQTRAFLADAVNALTSSLDYHTTLKQVATLAVPRLGDWCVVDMLDAHGQLRRLAIAHRDPEKIRVVERLTQHRPPRLDAPIGAGHVISTGRPDFYPDLPENTLRAAVGDDEEVWAIVKSLELRSLIAVPLVVRGKPVGAIVCVTSESRRRFTESDLEVATELAARASIAIENATLYREAEEARQRAEAADQAKSQFLAAMSHELRTPLNAIAGYAELIELGVHGPVTDKQREALERIQRSQKTLLALINDILNFSKLEAGFVDVEAADLDLGPLLANIHDWIEPQLRAKKLTYTFQPCAPDARVRGDRDKIQQVMLNLLSNAVKFAHSGGKITVDCAQFDDTIAISVSDTGPGIPADKLEAIFEPFVQLRHEYQGTPQGTGLGLAISRDLARAMDGDLHAESVLGQGARFVLTLPSAGSPRRRRTPAGQRAAGRGSMSGSSAAT